MADLPKVVFGNLRRAPKHSKILLAIHHLSLLEAALDGQKDLLTVLCADINVWKFSSFAIVQSNLMTLTGKITN